MAILRHDRKYEVGKVKTKWVASYNLNKSLKNTDIEPDTHLKVQYHVSATAHKWKCII